MPKKKAPKKKPAPEKDSKPKSSKEHVGFASARVERLIRNEGAFRVSADAISSLNDVISERGMKIAKYAIDIAHNSGRKTIKESDIKLAVEKV